MQNLHNDRQRIACAILAGGENRRMGRHKAFLDYNGRKFIDIIRQTAVAAARAKKPVVCGEL